MKKLLSLILAFALLFSVCAPAAFAAAPAQYSEKEYKNAYPVIIVRGMDFTDGLRRGVGTPEETVVNVVNNLSFGGVMKGLGGMIRGFFTGGSKGAVNALIDFAAGLFEGYACDENGEPLDKTVTSPEYPLDMSHYPEVWEDAGGHEAGLVRSCVERYGAKDVYYFIYDWRLDTLENAAKLDKLVRRALADHKAKKVDIVCCSMGGIVTLTYLKYYGSAKIDAVVSNSATMYGTDVTTDLLQGRVGFEPAAASRWLQKQLPQIAPLVRFLYKVGTVKLICDFLNRFAEKHKTEIYEGVLTPVFGTMPAFWELVKNEEYEAAKQFVFGTDTPNLIKKTDKIQREVVAKKKQILQNAMNNGMKFGILAGYNTPNVPAYESAGLQGDGTLETRMMSFGALVSEVGSRLSPEELAVGSPAYVSADGCINANTCMFRDITWFIKDSVHVACGVHSDYTYLILSILEARTQPNIRTWAKYPQFMQADAEENLTPLTDAPGRWDE